MTTNGFSGVWVHRIEPIDHCWELALTVPESIARIDADCRNCGGGTDWETVKTHDDLDEYLESERVRHQEAADWVAFLSWTLQAARFCGMEADARKMPRIAASLNPRQNDFFPVVVFKQDNNGTVFVVSQHRMDELGCEDDEFWYVAYEDLHPEVGK